MLFRKKFNIIKKSGLFNEKYYLTTYKDVRLSDIDPLKHYIKYGWKEGRNPSEEFNTNFYLESNQDVFKSKINPLVHYILYGKYENRKTDRFNINNYYEFIQDEIYEPKVSIIVPNYNHSKYLKKRLDCILKQTYKNFEVLLLDDCSTDNSRDILLEYAINNPTIMKCIFNEENAGNVFKQWKKGIENSTGDLIWICESDDFCEMNFLEILVKYFKNPAVNIAFGKIQFADLNDNMIEGLDLYRNNAEIGIWDKSLIRPANQWLCNGFGVNNLIANVGGCVFKKQTFESSIWNEASTYKILGDWFLYLHIANGGLIAYDPRAIAYFRQHLFNTSVSSFSTEKYYEEHFSLMKTMKTMWNIPYSIIDKFYKNIVFQYEHFNCENKLGSLDNYVNIEDLKNIKKTKKHILIALLSFHAGGGELFPLHLANELQKQGNIVSLFIFDMNNINEDMFKLVDKRIAIYDKKFIEIYGVENFIKDSGVNLINSHMVALDMFFLIEHKIDISYFPTLHGSYEACKVENNLIKDISSKVTHWIYTADKNLNCLEFLNISEKKITKLHNAMSIDSSNFPQSRKVLNISEDATVFTLVARGIKEKGWKSAIESFIELKRKYSNVHLLLCGEGDETSKYKKLYEDHEQITFLGYQSKIHGLYRISDCAIVPTRFEGESYPLCIIQALQIGLPIIGTDIGEIRSMITGQNDEFAGIILPYELDTQKFTEHLLFAMQQMMNNEIRQRFAQNSKKIATKYSMENLAKEYTKIFEKYRNQL